MKNIRIPITCDIKRSVDNPNWGILMNSASTTVRYDAWVKLWDGFEYFEEIWWVVVDKKI
jgi:hypothetical protein